MNTDLPNISKLSNGLTLLSYNMPYLKSVAINLIVKVGSRYETLKQSGIAHFLEHMAFKGTAKRSARNIAEEFDAIGGNFNAYTGKEQTVYHAKVLKEHTYIALEILSDILQNSVFNPEDIEKEREVIRQEMFQTEDNPDELAYENLYKTAFKDQPLGRSILGTEDSIADFSKQSFQNFTLQHYGANNLFLSIAGNLEGINIQRYAEQLFSQIQNYSVTNSEPAIYTGGYKFCEKDLEQTNIAIAFKSFSYTNLQKYYHTQILSLIFGGGFSSRLFQRIREDLGLAYMIGSSNSSYADIGLFSIYAATSSEKSSLLIGGIAEEIKKITEDISIEELNKAKAQIKASILMAEEKPAYKSEEIGKNFAIFGRYTPLNEVVELIMSSKINNITEIAKQIFCASPTLSIVGTKNAEYDLRKFSI